MKIEKIARGLGWFSLALGAAEMIAPRKLNSALGIRRRRDGLTRGFGAREIAAGIGILATRGMRAPWLWGRVAGDALDLAALGRAMKSNRKRMMVGAAIASVAAVTALDVWSGIRLGRESAVAAPVM